MIQLSLLICYYHQTTDHRKDISPLSSVSTSPNTYAHRLQTLCPLISNSCRFTYMKQNWCFNLYNWQICKLTGKYQRKFENILKRIRVTLEGKVPLRRQMYLLHKSIQLQHFLKEMTWCSLSKISTNIQQHGTWNKLLDKNNFFLHNVPYFVLRSLLLRHASSET